MPNELINASSLYLKQHAEQPVAWRQWSEDAFDEAKKRDVPVIVSIGYSACHWCHVMAHQCFDEAYIAELMNKHFVCIKVDREERPELDQIYMDAVQMLTGHGGWPLNVFCLPDGRPFFGGTYFPPEDKGQGVVPWPQLLMRIADYYRKKKEELFDNADNIVKNIAHNNIVLTSSKDPLPNEALVKAAQAICKEADNEWGGFGSEPKFPPCMALNFLMEIRSTHACDQVDGLSGSIDQSVNRTLQGMARGGIYDHLGGGFARYSVDKMWLIPHFEKMLYDNALLIESYLRGWMRYRNPVYKEVIESTVEWLKREMLLPEGGFASAIDADSEGEEGRFYVWSRDEIEATLGKEEAKAFCEAYNITEKGNFEDGLSNPALGEDSMEIRDAFKAAREKLLAVRNKRTRPQRDDKLLLSWNALTVQAIAEAGYYLNRPDWLELAKSTADLLWERFCADEGKLKAVAYGAQAERNGTLDDYAYFANALLSLSAKVDYLEPKQWKVYADRAKKIADAVLSRFADAEHAGYFYTSNDHEKLPARKKEWVDQATPSGNGTMVHVWSALYTLYGEERYSEELQQLRCAYKDLAEKAPHGIAQALSGFTAQAMGVPVVKIKNFNVLTGLQLTLADRPWRRTFLQITQDEQQANDYILCVGETCKPPTWSPHVIAEMI